MGGFNTIDKMLEQEVKQALASVSGRSDYAPDFMGQRPAKVLRKADLPLPGGPSRVEPMNE